MEIPNALLRRTDRGNRSAGRGLPGVTAGKPCADRGDAKSENGSFGGSTRPRTTSLEELTGKVLGKTKKNPANIYQSRGIDPNKARAEVAHADCLQEESMRKTGKTDGSLILSKNRDREDKRREDKTKERRKQESSRIAKRWTKEKTSCGTLWGGMEVRGSSTKFKKTKNPNLQPKRDSGDKNWA